MPFINPACAFGPALVMNHWDNHWVRCISNNVFCNVAYTYVYVILYVGICKTYYLIYLILSFSYHTYLFNIYLYIYAYTSTLSFRLNSRFSIFHFFLYF